MSLPEDQTAGTRPVGFTAARHCGPTPTPPVGQLVETHPQEAATGRKRHVIIDDAQNETYTYALPHQRPCGHPYTKRSSSIPTLFPPRVAMLLTIELLLAFRR